MERLRRLRAGGDRGAGRERERAARRDAGPSDRLVKPDMNRCLRYIAVAALPSAATVVLGSLAGVVGMSEAATAASATTATSSSSIPFVQDPLGPLSDVTGNWQHYQPAPDFCVKPDVTEVPPDNTPTTTGANPVCAASGFAASATGLVEVRIQTPPLCSGCRRLFIDYSKISPNTGLDLSSHGHVYVRPMSWNQTYTVGATSHSPNIKNLTNDALVAPPDSPLPAITSIVDEHAMAYVGDTANTAHIGLQGPYYVGPWYLNTAGDRIEGAYLDVDLSGTVDLPFSELDDIIYAAGFDADPALCPDALLLGSAYADGNYLYGACVDWFGASALPGIDPFDP